MTAQRRMGEAALPEVQGEGKIQASQRARLAVVYIRQSTGHQVLEHQESTRRQYALAQHAEHLGWAADRVLTISSCSQ